MKTTVHVVPYVTVEIFNVTRHIIPIQRIDTWGMYSKFRKNPQFRISDSIDHNGPLARYAKFRDAHAPGMPGMFSPSPRLNDPSMHHGTCVTHVPWCMPGSLANGFLWSRWRGKRSRHSRRMRNLQIYVSGKRSMAYLVENVTSQRRIPQLCDWV